MKINLNKTIMTLGVCALTTVAYAGDHGSQTSDINDTNNTSNWTVTPQGFVQMAAATHMTEIHLGKLALQKSSNEDVRDFAKTIVSDHQKSLKKLQSVAEKEGVQCPTNSMAMSMNGNTQTKTNSGNYENPTAEKVDKDAPPHLANLLVSTNMETMNNQTAGNEMNWAALSGAEFDRAFASKMVAGHEKAIRRFENASSSLQDAALKKYAENTLPMLREHLRKAQELQSKVGTWSENDSTNSTHQTSGYSSR